MDFILDASFALHWCFEDESTPAVDSILNALQNQTATSWVPILWVYEVLNGLGKAVSRGRLDHEKAVILWREFQGLPIRRVEVPADEALLELALAHNLAVYDASYLVLRWRASYPLRAATEN